MNPVHVELKIFALILVVMVKNSYILHCLTGFLLAAVECIFRFKMS